MRLAIAAALTLVPLSAGAVEVVNIGGKDYAVKDKVYVGGTGSGAGTSWVKKFGISDQQYKVSVNSTDMPNTTAGFYLTSFPCYPQNSNEYYKTLPGQNAITLYCMEPPKEIYLSYITKPAGSFFQQNEKMEGYMACPVKISGMGAGSVIPRLEVVVQECEKRVLNPKGNKQILSKGSSEAGKPVGKAMAKEDAAAAGKEPEVPDGEAPAAEGGPDK